MTSKSMKSRLFSVPVFRRWLSPARRALAYSLAFLLLTQAIIPSTLVYPRAAAHPAKSSGAELKALNAAGAITPPVRAATTTNVFGVVLTPLSTAFNGHTGIDYHARSRSVVVSANSPSGLPNNFELIDGSGAHHPFSNVSGLNGSLKVATARDEGQGATLAGFRPGEMFTGTGVPDAVARISADGAAVNNPWVTLPSGAGSIAGLHLDRTGVFGGDLIVVTDTGGVWRVSASAVAAQAASLNTPLSGVTTVPNDPARYGPWAGKILAGAKAQGGVYTVDAQGGATSYALGINPEEIKIVPAHENFFGLDAAGGKLWGAPADAFASLIGDVLVAQGSPGVLMRVRWNGTEFESGTIAQVAQWGQITFAPAGVAEMRSVRQVYDKLAVVRHAPLLNSGRVEGALWQLSAENVALGGTDSITSDLLVPGRPTVKVDGGHPNFGGVIEGVEDSQPTGYTVAIGANASLRHLITRTNPFEMEQVATPPAPSGARDVSITGESQSVGDFSTLRNLSLSGRAGAVSVPPGTYGSFSISGRTAIVLGVENATAPAVYNLQSLSLTGGSELRLAGPVVLTVRGEVSLAGSTIGAADNPRRLRLKVAEAGVKVSGGGVLYGIVRAPRGGVEITGEGRIRGTVLCDRLTISGRGVLQVTENDVPPPPVNRPPAVEAGANQVITLPSDTVSLNGTVSDDGLPKDGTLGVNWSATSGPAPVSFGNPASPTTTATFTQPGVYVLKLTASDGQLTHSDDVQVEVVPRNQPPVVNAGPDVTVKLPNSVNLNGTVSDDALPRGSTVSVNWSLSSGPAAPTFTDASAAATGVSFSAPGVYTLRLSASDTELTVSDELVVTVERSNQPPTADAGPDQSISLDESLPAPQEFKLRTISTNFNSPIGIDYHPPTGKVVMSVNYFAGGQPFNFELVSADGTHSPFSNICGLTDELKLATVRDEGGGMGLGGFQAGELFTGSGVPGVVVRVSPDGSSVQNPWVTLPGEPGLMRGSLHVDRTGVFGGDLIVVTTAGGVWRINSAGQPTQLARIPTHLEGLSTIPNNPDRYGPWAGKILIGAENERRFYTVDAQGQTAFYDIGISPEDIDIIPARENFFGVAFANGVLMGAPASAFREMVGDLLVTQEFGTLFRVRWNGTEFEKTALASMAQWEHVTFAPAGIVEIPPVGASVTLNGTVTDDNAPGFPLNVSWEKVSGPGNVFFTNPNQPVTQAIFNQAGTYVLRLAANDTEYAASDEVTVNVTSPVPPLTDATLALAPERAGPNVTGTSQTLRATLLDRHGLPIAGAPVHFIVSGVNAASGEAATNAFGLAELTYTGDAKGSDSVRATTSDGPLSVESNQATVSWVTPVQAISTTTVTGRFFHSNGSGDFTTSPTQQPAFAQFFPTINFNPPAGTIPDNTSGVGVNTHPFTNVTTDFNGNFTGTIIAQGNGLQAGVGSLSDFHAVFTGTFTVARPGNITFNFFSDDGFIFGVGGGAQRTGGVLSNPPPTGRTPFESFPVMGAYNHPTAPVANSVTVFFPAAGSYPYEVDYAECCGGELALTMTTAESGSKGVPPTGSLALSPNTPAARDAGQPQTFTVKATDASGNPMVGAPLRLTISGANARLLTDSTDAGGQASFTYTGANVGTDGLQVSTPVGASIAYSNVASMRWNVPNQPPVVNAGPDLNIASVDDAATLGGSVTDDNLPAGAPLTSQWTKLRGPGNVTFANPGAAATTARFSVAGVYVLRLAASDTLLSGSDEVTVTVNGTNQAPSVNAGPDQTITLPGAAQLSGAADDDGLPAGGTLAFNWSQVSGPGSVTFQNPNNASTLATFSLDGTYVLRLTASDSEMSASDEMTVTANAPVPPPVAELASPANGSNITDRTSIIGSVSGGPWRLEYSLNNQAPGQAWTTLASGNTPVTNGLLGIFDPTLLLNGSYTIRLVASGADGQTTISTLSALVSGDLKVGIFTVSFTDLEVPAAGLPITVSRTYDSRDKRTGDFGVGWWLGMRNVRVEKSKPLGSDWEQTVSDSFLPNYCLRPTKPSNVAVTLPDGTVYAFATTPNPQCQLLAPVQFTNLSFTQLPGDPATQGATLTALGGENEAFFTGSAPGIGDLVDNDTFDLYNPSRFKLTTSDGTTLIVNEMTGLESLSDSNGNTLTIGPGGVIHSSGKSITFTRDAQGRITRITDPVGNSINYAYDLNGDLVSMTDQDGRVTRYSYNSSHGLLDIIDPLNRRGVRNEYDASGRLVAITDEAGKTIRFEFNPNSRQQVVTDRRGSVTVYEFDARGKPLSVTNAEGQTLRATYDGAGNRLTQTDHFGNTTIFTYDARGNILTRTDAQNRVTRFTYNERNQVTSVTDVNGNTTASVYDAKGNLTSATDALGNTTSFTYNTSGDVLTFTDAANHTSAFQYDPSGNMTKMTDRLGNSTRFAYDAVGNLTSETDARGSSTQFNFNNAGLLTSTVDALGNTRRNEYDGAGTLSTGIDELGHRTEFTSNFLGMPLQTTRADGTKFSVQYDANGNIAASSATGGLSPTVEHDRLNLPTKITVAPGVSVALQHDAAGRRTAASDPLGNTTTYQYNLLNKVAVEADALGNQTRFNYDAVGNLISQTDANGNTTTHTYDKANRRLRTTLPDGSFFENTYDALGQVTSTRDALGNVTTFTYDDEGQLLSVTQPGGGVTRYQYDANGNLTSSTDANGRKTSLEYDQLNRLVKKTFPDAATERTTYDGAGNITSVTDRAGRTTTYERDQMDRLTLVRYPDGKTVAYTYTANGKRDTVTDARGVTDFDYDALGNVTKVRFPDATTVSYAYDIAGNRTAITTPDGTTRYGYDKNNRLVKVTDPRGLVTSYTYDAAGNVARINHPNGLVTTKTYDNADQMTAITTTRPDGQTVFRETYTNDASGRRTGVTRADGSAVQYAYDAQSRLTRETYTDASGNVTRQTGYTYDAVGNRLTISDGLTNNTLTYTYDANDQLLSDGAYTFTYDANGNTVSKSAPGAATHFAYDALNRLSQVTQPDGATLSYSYDAQGNRVRATDASGAVTNYVVDPTTEAPRVLVETDGGGHVVATYTYGLELISQRRGGLDSFYLQDALGSTRALTDAAGSVTDTYTYDAFGQLIASTGSTLNSFLYAGEQRDAATDLYYLRARYYNPSAGRFMSMDRYQGRLTAPSTQHKYAYTENDPVNSTDPTGRFTRQEGNAIHQILGRYYLEIWDDYWVSKKVLKASKALRLKGLVYGPNGKGAYDRYVRTGNPGKGDPGSGRPDLRNYENGDVYEIKPFNPEGIARALEEVEEYTAALNLLEAGAPESGEWIYGRSSFFPAVSGFPFDFGRLMGVFAPPLSMEGCIFYYEIPLSTPNIYDLAESAVSSRIQNEIGQQMLRVTQTRARPGVLTGQTVGRAGLRLVVNNAKAKQKEVEARVALAPVVSRAA